MSTENMNILAKQFLKKYTMVYLLDLSASKDAEELKKAIENLEAEECKEFMRENAIDILSYNEFRKSVQDNLEEFITEERNYCVLKKFSRENTVKRYSNNLESFRLENNNEALTRELLQIINQMTTEEFSDYISEYAKEENDENAYFMAIVNTEEQIEELELLRADIKWEILKRFPSLAEASRSEETSLVKTTPDMNKIEGFMDELIAQIPFGEFGNQEDVYKKIEKRLIEYLESKNVKNETLELALSTFKRKYDDKIKLNYYQKVVDVFNTFNFDHLSKEDKEYLLQDIKNGKILSKEDQTRLHVTDEELKNIQKDILTKLEEVNSNITTKEDIIAKYLDALKKADESYLETLESYLNIENFREKEEMVANLSDEEIIKIIEEIKEKGKEITLDKILELPEVKNFVNPLLAKLNQAETLEDIKNVETELNAFVNGKQMLGLTDFNKALLVERLLSHIAEQKKIIIFKEQTNELLTDWIENIKETDTNDLMPLYQKIDKFTKEDFGLKEVTDEELNILKDIIKDKILDELTIRIIKDLGGLKEENLDLLIDKIMNWTKEDFEKYQIPENLQEEIKNRFIDYIENIKQDRKEIDQKVDALIDINSQVYLTKDVPIYENEQYFDENTPLNNKVVKANKKGIITGYVVKKDDSVVVLNSKEDLTKYLRCGYDIIGYEYNYKRHFKNQYTYVNLDEVAATKKNVKNKWSLRKSIMTIVLAAATLLAATGIFKVFQKSKERNQGPATTIENVNPELIEDELNNTINVDGQMVELDEEIINTLNRMPSTKADWQITEDARIWENAEELGNTPGKTSYFNTHGEYDLDRQAAGYVLKDLDGNQKICMDCNEAFYLINDENYTYMGTRALNKHSKNAQDYEGIFYDDSIIVDEEDSLLKELQENGVSRRLTK
jgi:hypothetical protein